MMWRIEFEDDDGWRTLEEFRKRAGAYSRLLMLKLYNSDIEFRIVWVAE